MIDTALSISGGGIKGLGPCVLLAELERQLGGLVREHITFCGGTSTGGLLTAGIAAGVPAAQMLEVYMGPQAEKIFAPTVPAEQDAAMLAKGWCFDPQHLYEVLIAVLGNSAWSSINDLPIAILITAVGMNGHRWYFVEDNEFNGQMTGETLLIDAATATACAPPYFTHRQVKIIGLKNMRGTLVDLWDGGVGGLANPIYQVATEIFKYRAHTPLASNQIISLGTGWCPNPNPKTPGNILEVIENATDTLVDTSEDWATEATRDAYGQVRLQTFNPQLPSNVSYVDLASRPTLLKIWQDLAATMDWGKILA